MSAELLSSKVIVVEEEPRVRGISTVSTSVAGAVGVAERGPVAQAVLVTSPDEYEERFGGFTRESDLALGAMGFFEQGGTQLWCVRTTHFTDAADPATTAARRASAELRSRGGASAAEARGGRAPFRLAPGAELVFSVGGAADVTVAFEGTPASVASPASAPYALADGETLTVRFEDGGEQRVEFDAADFVDIGAATALEVAAAINAQLVGGKAVVRAGALALRSDTAGRVSSVEVTGGDANDPLGFPLVVERGTGNVEDLAAVTFEEVSAALVPHAAAITAARTDTGELVLRTVALGAAASLQLRAATSAALSFDNELHRGAEDSAVPSVRVEGKDPGTYAHRLDVVVRPATSGRGTEFDLLVVREGTVTERFPNLSVTPGDARHVEAIVNDPRAGSGLIRIAALELGAVPTPQTVRLAGGDDGLLDLADVDFLGSEAGKTGLHALDRVLDLALLFVPGRATPAVHQGMVSYCEIDRRGSAFPLLDPPLGMSATEIVEYVENTSGLLSLSEFGAIYWPRVKVRNPSRSVFGSDDTVVVPPSGIVAGVCARNDAARPGGVYDGPAGIEKGRMLGVLGFETDEVLEETKRDLIYPRRINPLTTAPGRPRFIDGSRTLKGNGNFPFVGSRRGVIFIAGSLQAGLDFVRHRNPTEDLLEEVDRTARAFLIQQTELNAFKSRDPDKAFFLEVSQRVISVPGGLSSRVLVRAGLAVHVPAEFVVISLSADTRAIEGQLGGAGGGA